MPRISQNTRHRIAEQALGLLLEKYPVPMTTREVAKELVRDKEFTKTILEMLRGHGLVKTFGKPAGAGYARWLKWQLTDEGKRKLEKAEG